MPALAALEEYCKTLDRHYGPAPAGANFASPFAAALAAIVGRAELGKVLQNLAAVLPEITPASVWSLPPTRLAEALRPAGFAPDRAKRLRALLAWLAGQAETEIPPDDASLEFLNGASPARLRDSLLKVRGLGPESVDFFLLHALDLPFFAASAQAYRLLRRHGFVGTEAEYSEIQDIFRSALPEDTVLYRRCRLHLERLGAEFCRKAAPRCATCPLKAYMEYEPYD
jgi:endonuclease-3 related protein